MRKKFVCPLVGIKSRALDVLGKHSTTELYTPRLQAFPSFEKNLHTFIFRDKWIQTDPHVQHHPYQNNSFLFAQIDLEIQT